MMNGKDTFLVRNDTIIWTFAFSITHPIHQRYARRL